MMMMNIIRQVVSGSTTLCGFQHVKPRQTNPPTNIRPIFTAPKQKEPSGFRPLSSHARVLHKFGTTRRKYVVYSVEPGASPSGPPPNILSWIVAVAIAVVVPFINYKWGPLLKKKVEAAMQTTEDVAEAVEKVAEDVEKAAEDIADDLPKNGRLRKAVDFIEKIAERTAMEAGAVDEFIDKVQEEEEKAESFVDSLKDKSEKPPKDPDQVKPKDQN